MIEKLVDIFKPSVLRMTLFLSLYLFFGGLFMAGKIQKSHLYLVIVVFGLMNVFFDSHFDLYKTNKYKNQFILTVFLAAILLLILSMFLVYFGVDVDKNLEFKSFAFNIYILVGGYIMSVLVKEIRYFREK